MDCIILCCFVTFLLNNFEGCMDCNLIWTAKGTCTEVDDSKSSQRATKTASDYSHHLSHGSMETNALQV